MTHPNKASEHCVQVRPLPFNISWKSENRVSKSKIEFPAFASILSGVFVHHNFLKKKRLFWRDLNTQKIVIFGCKLLLRLASDSKKNICAYAQSSFEFPIPLPIPSKFSEKRMGHSLIPIPSGFKGITIADQNPSLCDFKVQNDDKIVFLRGKRECTIRLQTVHKSR